MALTQTVITYELNESTRQIEKVSTVQVKDTGGTWRDVEVTRETVDWAAEDSRLDTEYSEASALASALDTARTTLSSAKVQLDLLP